MYLSASSPRSLSFSPLDGASDDYADSNEEQDDGTTIINGQRSLQLVRNNVCIFLSVGPCGLGAWFTPITIKNIGHVFELDCCDKCLVEAFCVGLTEIVSYFCYCAP